MSRIVELLSLIEAMVPRFNGRLWWIMIGNEIDLYFEKHGDEAAAYATLLGAASDKLHALLPDVQVSHTVTSPGPSMESGVLKPLFDRSDFLSLPHFILSFILRHRPIFDVSDFPMLLGFRFSTVRTIDSIRVSFYHCLWDF
jgi:hypothetical protein